MNGKRFYVERGPRKRVFFEIADNDSGIREEDSAVLFEPFYSSTKGGMGLGLFVVHNIITLCQGKILISNNEEGGATFQVMFPIVN